jgi:hypothetical protein
MDRLTVVMHLPPFCITDGLNVNHSGRLSTPILAE